MNINDINGRIDGQGPAVVLLHGFCETHHIWEELIEVLGGKYKVLCPDLPGFGDSILSNNSFSLDDISLLLKNWIASHRVQNCIMIGHSLGGYVTLAFAKKFPEMLQGIGLFHSSVYGDDENKKSIRNKTIEFITKNGVEAFVDAFFQNLFYDPNLKKPYIREKLKAISERAKLLKASVINAYLEVMRDREDSRSWVSSFSKPVLMIAGTEDNAVPIELSREQAELSEKIQFHELNNTGHMGMYEQQSSSFEIIKNFLAQ